MSDWGAAFDEQCRAEGIEVPEKAENQSNSQMDHNEENKGFKGAGIGRGGMFGGPSKVMNAPPPQTSFGATAGTRVGGAFGSQSSGPDGRGAPIGSDEVVGGGGNVISVSMHRDKPASPLTRGGGFGTNRSFAPNPPTSFKTNHEGGRFGTLAPKSTGGSFSSNSSEISEKPKMGGSFGSSQATEPSRSSVGGSFGSLRTASSTSTSRSSIGGAFGSKSSSSDVVTEPSSPVGGSFGAPRTTSTSTASMGGSFGSAKPATSSSSGTVGGGFGAKPQGSATVGGGFGKQPTQGATIGGGFGSTRSSSTAGSLFGGQTSPSPVPQEKSSSFNFSANMTTPRSEKVGGTFGSSTRRALPEIPDMSTPPPPIFGGGIGSNRPTEPANSHFGSVGARTTPTSGMNSKTIGGGFGFGSKENRDPISSSTNVSSKIPEISPEKNLNRGGFGYGIPVETRTFGGGFGKNKIQESRPSGQDGEQENRPMGGFRSNPVSLKIIDDEETKQAPFMGNQQTTPMRGGFQGGFRGGRGSGGQMDFAGGQGHSMGRGRGQPTQSFAPRQTPPPQFAGHSPPTVIPDPKYKYTKQPEESHEQAPIPADIALLNKFIQKEVKMMKDMVVDVQRQDPKSPLYSISSFRELRLKPEVLQALDTLNFQFPTRIQETALPLLLMEPPSNLIAQAQSGTGKTAAFVLTMLCRIDVNLPYPQCICLAPTLELAKQIGEVVEKMGAYMENLKIHYAIKGGNMAAMRGRKLTEQIVIGTPGITRDYLQKYRCIDPSKIRCLVLDEADVMIYHQGFTDISTTIYNMVEEASDSVQSMLFSATYDEPVITFATKIIKNAIVVMLKREEQALPNIKQFYVQCACRDSKYAAIVNLYSGLAVASSVIFCHTKASVMWLFENMKARGHQVDVLHGDMTVVERADTIIRFKRGDFKVLITTNVFARGIDVAQVSVVINYDLPIKYDDSGNPKIEDGFTQPDCETYLHRIGRTGRFGKTGIAINFIDSEDSMNMINVLENHFQMKITRMDPSNLLELEAIEMA